MKAEYAAPFASRSSRSSRSEKIAGSAKPAPVLAYPAIPLIPQLPYISRVTRAREIQPAHTKSTQTALSEKYRDKRDKRDSPHKTYIPPTCKKKKKRDKRDASFLATGKPTGYTAPACAKKAQVGFGDPLNGGTRPQTPQQCLRPFPLRLQVLAARMGGRKACRFGSAVPGSPTRSSRRPHLAMGASAVATPNERRPFMAKHTPFLGDQAPADTLSLDTGLQDNWRSGLDNPAIVSFTPAATAHDRLVWCWTQISEMDGLLEGYVDLPLSEDSDRMASALCVFVQQRLKPLERVLSQLCTQSYPGYRPEVSA